MLKNERREKGSGWGRGVQGGVERGARAGGWPGASLPPGKGVLNVYAYIYIYISIYIYIYMLTPPPMIHVLVLKRGGRRVEKTLQCTSTNKFEAFKTKIQNFQKFQESQDYVIPNMVSSILHFLEFPDIVSSILDFLGIFEFPDIVSSILDFL